MPRNTAMYTLANPAAILLSETFIRPNATPSTNAIAKESSVISSVFLKPVSNAGIDCLTSPRKPTFCCSALLSPLSVIMPEIDLACSFAPCLPRYCATIRSYSPEAIILFNPSLMAASKSAFMPLFTAMPYSPCGTFGVTIFRPLFCDTPYASTG